MWVFPEQPSKKGENFVLYLYVLRSFEFITSDIWLVVWIFHHSCNYFDCLYPHLKCAQELFLDFCFVLFCWTQGSILHRILLKFSPLVNPEKILTSSFWWALFQVCPPPGLGLLSCDSRMSGCKARWSESWELACLGSWLTSGNGKLEELIVDCHQVTKFTFFLPQSLSLISVSF